VTPREIVQRAIEFKRPPRLPINGYGEASDVAGVGYDIIKPPEAQDDELLDQWLCRWEKTDQPNMGQVKPGTPRRDRRRPRPARQVPHHGHLHAPLGADAQPPRLRALHARPDGRPPGNPRARRPHRRIRPRGRAQHEPRGRLPHPGPLVHRRLGHPTRPPHLPTPLPSVLLPALQENLRQAWMS